VRVLDQESESSRDGRALAGREKLALFRMDAALYRCDKKARELCVTASL
jgi:hypothetical protein